MSWFTHKKESYHCLCFHPYNFRMEFSILDNCEGEDFAIVCQLIFDLIFLTGFEPDLEGFISRLTFSSPKYFALFSGALRVNNLLIPKEELGPF